MLLEIGLFNLILFVLFICMILSCITRRYKQWQESPKEPCEKPPQPAKPCDKHPLPERAQPERLCNKTRSKKLDTQSLQVPFDFELSKSFDYGRSIVVEGIVNATPHQFVIDLRTGSNILFHFNPRFDEQGSKVIVCNSFVENQWGKENRSIKRFPFYPGEAFKITLKYTRDHIIVYIGEETDPIIVYGYNKQVFPTLQLVTVTGSVSITNLYELIS